MILLFMLKRQHFTLTKVRKVKSYFTTPLIRLLTVLIRTLGFDVTVTLNFNSHFRRSTNYK